MLSLHFGSRPPAFFCPYEFRMSLFLFDVMEGITFGRKGTIVCVLVGVSQHVEAEKRVSV